MWIGVMWTVGWRRESEHEARDRGRSADPKTPWRRAATAGAAKSDSAAQAAQDYTAPSTAPRRARVAPPAAMALGAVVALLLAPLFLAGSAHADAFGELGQVGKFGKGASEFTYPTGLAVDQEDNSVFVVDEPEGQAPGVVANAPANFRLQKFSAALAFEGSATIPTPQSGSQKQFVAGVAVDAKLGRVYVLKAIQTERGSFEEVAATEIDVYSTRPEAGSLPLASGVKTDGKQGVYFVFPAVESSGPLPAGAVLEPHGLAVEPETDGLIILGNERKQPTVLWRVSGTEPFTTGAFSESETFLDSGSLEGGDSSIAGATSVAAGPHDELYLSSDDIGGGGGIGVDKLVTSPPNNSLANPAVTVVHDEGPSTSPPGLTGGKDETFARGNGPQVAASSDGSLVYAAQVSAAQGVNGKGEPTAGSFEMRGMSTSDGSQRIVLGGGTNNCRISSEYNAVATGSGGVVYALDEGESYFNASSELTPSPFGFDLVEFGPGGEHCPAPVLSVTMPVKAEKGQLVELAVSEVELKGAVPGELTWKSTEGPESWEVKETTNPKLKTTHRFLKPGVYSVELSMNVTNSPFGQPSPVTKKIEVTALPPEASFVASTPSPKSGESVTFNAAGSRDPEGSCSEATGCTSTEELKYTWKFGDGTKIEGEFPESTYSRSFTNTSSQPRQETVELIVTNKESVQSVPFVEHLTIQGTETPPPGGGGGGGGTVTLPPQGPSAGPPPPPPAPVVKPLTNAQKLAKALRVCRKIKSHKKRTSCEKHAKAKYGPKSRHKKK